MIYTVTFNPALDYIVSVPDFCLGKTNRAVSEQMFPGGKGVNVSIVLKNLGITSTVLGFRAGFVGEEIDRQLKEMGIQTKFTDLDSGCSRINVKWKESDGTEVNGKGPDIPSAKIRSFLTQLDSLEKGDWLVLAGSVPGSMSSEIYRDILKDLSPRGVSVVVDAAGDLLRQVLPYHPFLVKPNHHELGELFGVELFSRQDVIPYAKKLKDLGAVNVLVSMSKEGAVFVDEKGEVYTVPALEGRLVNAVGAGDSMVAGFLAGWLTHHSYEYAFRMGVAAGSASAFSEGLAGKEYIFRLYERL